MGHDDQGHSSKSSSLETEDGCSVLLELSKSDPLFAKKKKLLESRGFGPSELVHLKNSHSSEWMCRTLKVMLQISRIIHLDEVELYFGENDACLEEEFYSPRNEMVALSSILSLFDISLPTEGQKQMNILQDFRDAVISMICDFGKRYREESTIISNYSCDTENNLLHWGQSNGVRSKLQISYVEEAGRGATATEDLKVGDVALEIPVSIIIYEDLVHDSDMYHVLKNIDGISSETMLLLWSMKEKHNCNSRFRLYFDTLPEHFNTGLSFGVDAIMALEGTLIFEEIMQAKEHLRTQYDELFPALCNNYPDIFLPECYSWEQFLWACELWYSNGMKVMFADGKLRTCLIPIAGFLNHSLYPHIVQYGKVDSMTNSLKFTVSRPCGVGEECCLSYGNYSASHLITFYGFMPNGDNPYDVIPLDIEAAHIDSSEDESVSNWTTHMVRGTWFSKNHGIFHYGLPSPLLDCLRRAQDPILQSSTNIQAKLENEMEVLEIIRSIFDNMMENLGDTEFVDRKGTSWDVKLASDFKNLQRKIVSSILTSCNAGLKLVEGEICKCRAE